MQCTVQFKFSFMCLVFSYGCHSSGIGNEQEISTFAYTMKKLKQWFIGDYLKKTADVFEKARIELVYDYSLFFFILGLFFYGNLIAKNLWYHFYVISFAMIALGSVLFILKFSQNLKKAGNWFVIQQTVTSSSSVYIQEANPDMSGPLWTMSFIIFVLFIFGTTKGIIRLIPFFGIFILTLVTYSMEEKLDFGIPESQQLPNEPFVALIPFCLCVYLVIVFLRTNRVAERQIIEQKILVEQKNKEIIDSIRYAKRIQMALLPGTKTLEKGLTKK